MSATESTLTQRWIGQTTVASLALLSISELLFLFLRLDLAATVGRVAFCLVCLCVVPRFTLRETALGGMAIALAIGMLSTETGLADFLYALDRAAFFAAFIYLVTLLKEAAERSPSILRIGYYLTNQPPGRRYFTTAIGGHLLGVLLNFGAISLLAPLIQRGARAGPMVTEQDKRRARIREQRQISALLRGFSWMILWAPTALTQAILLTTFPEIDVVTVMSLGLLSTVIMILIGRWEDLFRWRHIIISQPAERPVFPQRPALNLLFVCLVLIGSTYAVVLISKAHTAVALMLVAPIVMTGWVISLNRSVNTVDTLRRSGDAIAEIFFGSAVTLSRAAFALGMSGFIGQAAAYLAPVEAIAESMNLAEIPPWLFLAALPLIINLGGQIALSPIMVVVFLGSVMHELPVLPADPSLIVFALGAGWALSMSASPNATATLLISGTCGIPPTTLTWRWNGRYALLCYAVFCVMFYLLTV